MLHGGQGQPGACGRDLVMLWTPVGSQSDSRRQMQSKWSGGENAMAVKRALGAL